MKRIVCLLLLAMIVLAMTGCAGRHSIEIAKGSDLVASCPKTAKAGDLVTVKTRFVTDGWIEMEAGVDVTHDVEDTFQFTMPDHDVYLRLSVVSAW